MAVASIPVMHRSGRWAAVLILFALLGGACSGDDDEPAADDSTADGPVDDDATEPADDPAETDRTPPPADPADDRYADVGEGVAITMARSDDPDGRFQAEVVRQLLEQLGYAVNDPADVELSPADFYDAIGRGEVDFWANARLPEHDPYLDVVIRIEPFVAPEPDEGETDDETAGDDDEAGDDEAGADGDGEDEVVVVQQPVPTENAIEILVRDEVTVVGSVVPDGGVAGFVTNVSIAFDNPGLTLDAIVDDDALFDLYDAADVFLSPALAPDEPDDDTADPADDAGEPVATIDGVIQILGCPEDEVCADQIDEMIRFARWRGDFEQVHGEYDVLVEEALRRIAANQPVILFLRGPSPQMMQLIPGENVMWVAMEPDSVLNGSITRAWNQRVEGADGEQVPNPVAPDTCTAEPCHLGWLTNDIAITANNEFLDRHPAAATLLEQIEIPAADINNATARVRFGDLRSVVTDKTPQAAREWIEANRDLVERWLDEAIAAA